MRRSARSRRRPSVSRASLELIGEPEQVGSFKPAVQPPAAPGRHAEASRTRRLRSIGRNCSRRCHGRRRTRAAISPSKPPRDPDHRRCGACGCARAPADVAPPRRRRRRPRPRPGSHRRHGGGGTRSQASRRVATTRTSRPSSRAAAPISPMAMSPPHDSPFAAPPRAAMRRRRSRSVEPSIRWSSRASAPSGSRPIRIQARGWYQKAAELGSRDAPQRLDQFAQSDAVRP